MSPRFRVTTTAALHSNLKVSRTQMCFMTLASCRFVVKQRRLQQFWNRSHSVKCNKSCSHTKCVVGLKWNVCFEHVTEFGFQFSTVMNMNMSVYWDGMVRNLIDTNQRFGGAYWPHHQGAGDSKLLWNVFWYLLDYMAEHPRNRTSYSIG
jgi:hypothetical protein